jgi:RES domain-containing protein
VLVHYSVLPKDHVLTEIRIPYSVAILDLALNSLPEGWNAEVPVSATQEIGSLWVREGRSAVLAVPSSIIPGERNFIINSSHSAFAGIGIQPSQPFYFDPRLKR